MKYITCVKLVSMFCTHLKLSKMYRMWKKRNHKKKTSFPSFGYRHILLAFWVWFHGTLDRLKSLLVKKWYNNIAARDESPLISRSLSNPLFNCTVEALRVNGTIESPANEKAQSWHHSHAVWQMDGEERSRNNIRNTAAEAGVQLLFH